MSTVAEKVGQLVELLQDAQTDAVKFDGGNNAAGTRVRKTLGDVAKACKTVRADVIAERNSRKEG